VGVEDDAEERSAAGEVGAGDAAMFWVLNSAPLWILHPAAVG